MRQKKADKIFLIVVLILLAIGSTIFISASLGLLSRDGGASFGSVAFKQFALLPIGLIGLFITANINYRAYRRLAFWAFIVSIAICMMVFLPKVGFGAKGAHRWINLGFTTFQPSELLKLGYVLYLAYWFSTFKDKANTFLHGLVPFLVITGMAAVVLRLQHDTGTFMVLFAAGFAIFFVGGAKWRYTILLPLLILLCVGTLAYFEPYVRDRIVTFLNPSSDVKGASWQINQSLIAIGSGQLTGRGFGQSVQKFNYLPEPIGDSIFAVASEEFGFIGSTTLVLIFLIFTFLGLKIAVKTADPFGRLLCVGIVILISSQAFVNISAMLGIIPLTGVPLIFVSQGGSALIIALTEIGIVLNISKLKKA